jgi:mRNA interferase MazF
LKVIVPITGWNKKFEAAPWMVKISPDPENKLEKASAADCFQVRSVSEKRLVKKIGKVSDHYLKGIQDGLMAVFSIG